MRKLPKIIVILLLVAAVIFAAGCVQERVTPVNKTVTPVNKTVTPVNETVAPVNESVVQVNVSAGTNRTVTVNDGKKTHSRNHNTPTTTENNTTENNTTENNTTENNTTEDNVTTPTQIVNLSVHGHSTKIVSLKVTPENPTVSLGQTQQFTAIGTFSDSSIKDITDIAILSSSNTTVASISNSGLATSKSKGITQINATYDGISSTDQTLTVTEVKLVSIEIFPVKPTVHLGQTQKFTAIGTYSDGNMKDITANAAWLSSNTNVASISAVGLASSISLGTTQINATCDGISSPDQRLKVIDATLKFVTVTPQNPNITLNRTQQFIANGTYSDGSIKDITSNVKWSSSNTTVANISASGLATPSSTGITQINATNGDIECLYPQLCILSQTLTVTDAKLISIAITPLDPIVTLNQTQQFIANGTYSDGSRIDITAIVNWSSSNATVSNISASGLAMAVSPGTTQINATINGISSLDQTLTVPEPQHNNTNVIRLISIEISPVNPIVALNETQQFSANGTYSDGSKKDITANATWSSSNTTVANINASGLATPSSVGTTQINATINGISSPDQTLTVPEPQHNNTNVIRLLSIEISPVNPIVALNETQQFSANGTYSDGSIKDITATATWLSSNTTVANINASGLATPSSAGTTQINATINGISSPDQTLTVPEPQHNNTNVIRLLSIEISPVNPIVALNETQQFSANGTYSDGSKKDITANATWSSSNTTVANINASGLATPSSAGTTQINATIGEISSPDQTLTVPEPQHNNTNVIRLLSIEISPVNPIVALNETQQFIANGTYSDGSTKDITATATWSTSNSTVADINASGLATSTSSGTTQINATSEGISSTDQTLTVTDANLVSITVTPANPTISLGHNQQFIANGTYSDGNIKDITGTVTWLSSNTLVASINATGLATSASLGFTQINATSEGISSNDQTLTVTDANLVSITVTPLNPAVSLGQNQQFTANGTYSDGSTKDITATVTWLSSNATVASINASGLATSTSSGTTQINATSDGISSTDQTLTVTAKLVSIIVSPLNPIVSLGQTQQFIATGTYSDESTKDITDTVIWSSSNTSVASVNASGLATSTSLGTTQINATSDGISSSDRSLTVTDGFGITIVPYMDSEYKYKIVNHGENAGFEDVNYDDSDFSMGNASFGLIKPGYCDIYSLKYIKTLWPEDTDILLRKEFVLPAGVTNLKVYIAVDDDVQVFINGHDVSNGIQIHEMCAEWDYFEFPVNNSLLKTGTNLLAVRGKDRGVVNFLDTKITADQKSTVAEAKLVSITVTPLNPTVSLGQTQQFTATGNYSDGSIKDITDTVIWSSSNTTVVSINASGLVTSVSTGITQINATIDGISSTDQTLTVTEAKLVSITITPVNPKISQGQTQQFIATGTYSDGSTKDITATAIWLSSNATVASINASGLATSISIGTTQINATSEGISSPDQVLAVTVKLVSIIISPLNPTVSLDQTQQFIATGTYADESTKDISDAVIWTSSNTTVAGVNASGLATSTSLGTTQINAIRDGISSSDRTLTVTDGFGITLVPYMDSKYKYKIVNYGESAGFEDVNYDDSDFSMGNSSFGLIKPGYCDIYSSKYIKTLWPEYTDILLRKEFVLPAGVTNLKVYITVDDDVQVFINGHDVSNGIQKHQMCAEWDYFEFPVDNSILKTGTNLLAVRGRDHGGVNFLDTKITADQKSTVAEAKLVSITVAPLNPTVSLGQTQQFIATGNYSDGSIKDITDTVIWSSSNTSVASVNASGLAASTSLGTTQISATSDGISSSDRSLTVTDGFGITIVPYMDSRYKYKIVNYGESAGFEDVNYDDSDFSMGNASFGLIKPGICDIYSSKYIMTSWQEYTDILLRKEFVLPAGVTNLKVYVAVDDDVQVFINGHDVSNGTQTHEMCAEWDYFEFPVDNSILKTGTNLLAVRGKDHGGVNFLDTKITADY